FRFRFVEAFGQLRSLHFMALLSRFQVIITHIILDVPEITHLYAKLLAFLTEDILYYRFKFKRAADR
ncbi:MAG: hypothetical protein K6U80_02850, partial [Firmicutes bacterium]|nr:hypothetical protein [Bacillota bacterium]